MTKAQQAERKRANQEAAGIPDSKPFAAPHAEPTGEDRMLASHINGVLIGELNLPPNVLLALDWNATDEGIAAHNARPMMRPPSGIVMGNGNFEKALEQRRDDVKEKDIPLYEARDPLKEVADRHAVPGMRAKFLSAFKVKDSGGTGDYEVVKKENGDPVMVKGMVLAHIPEAAAKARQRHFQERGNQLLKQIGEVYKREGGETAVADQ
jgi:hypothetical protein